MTLDRTEWTVPAQLRLRAAQRPDDVAQAQVDGAVLTFAGWDSAAQRIAAGLHQRGVAAGDRILLPCAAAQWIDYAIAWAGVLRLGAVAVPVADSAGADQLATAFQASGAVCVVGDATGGLGPHYRTAELTGDDVPSLTVTSEDDAEIIFTSGTTGRSKGVVASHANLLHPVRTSQAREPRMALHALPPGTTVGQGLLVQPLSFSPHRTLTLGRFTPAELFAAIATYRPTDVVLVPAMAIALVTTSRPEIDLSSVRQVRTTSAPIHPATLEAMADLFPAARIRNVYSTTECWPRRMATDYDRARPNSLGRPVAGSQVRIIDAAGGEAPPGTRGDVQLRSDAPQRRYDGEATVSTVFLDGGWTRTGDVGLVDPDGYFYLVDRNPDLVNTGGLNVSTLDVEASIMDFPNVIEAAVCGIPHPVLTECVMAAVRARPELDLDALVEFVRVRQGPAAPQRIVVVDELPRNLLGKVDKKQLRRDLELAGDHDDNAPATPTELLVAELWATALDLGRVGGLDDFLRLGGSSLTAMEVVAQIADRMGRRVTVRDLLDTTSLRAFAARVDAAETVAPGDASTMGDNLVAPVGRPPVGVHG